MTQISLPQDGQGVGDSGTYLATEWAQFFEVVFTGDQSATQSILREYLNELEITLSGGTVSINTGSGFCYGRWLLNDTSIDITPTACAGVETRWDRVVLVQNETAAIYNTNLLLPAAYAAGVPRNSCRIAILRGTCGSPGALPALLTGPNYYMVELARYQVTGASIGTIIDYRDYCSFSTLAGADSIADRTRRIWVPTLAGYESPSTYLTIITAGNGPSILLADGVTAQGHGRTVIPADFDTVAQELSVRAVVVAEPPSSGNIYGQNMIFLGRCGYNVQYQVNSTGSMVDTFDGGSGSIWRYNCVQELESTLAINYPDEEFIRFTYHRYAGDALDTVNTDAYLLGWIVEYTADS